ncbi:hypothetical protein C8J56DRAFT_567580 [Mycena floridula]|nr:hypothetical protein C8J56DRAFT_567580 [Mycena floridula]
MKDRAIKVAGFASLFAAQGDIETPRFTRSKLQRSHQRQKLDGSQFEPQCSRKSCCTPSRVSSHPESSRRGPQSPQPPASGKILGNAFAESARLGKAAGKPPSNLRLIIWGRNRLEDGFYVV